MAKSGILGQAKPNGSALLYRAPIDSAASAVLTVANDGTGAAYSVGIKDYDQDLTVDAATYLLHRGDIISSKTFSLDNFLTGASLTAGDLLTSSDLEKTAKFHSFFVPSLTTVYVKAVTLHALTLSAATGVFSAGDTVTTGDAPDDTTALVYDVYVSGSNTIILVGPETINGAGAAFTDSDIIASDSGGSGTIATGGVDVDVEYFVFSNTIGGIYSSYDSAAAALEIYNDRVYRFDLSDASMTGRDFKLSLTSNGEWGPDGVFGNIDDGAAYTDGVTTNGTPGSGGAYLEISFIEDQLPPTSLYFYDGGTGTAGNSNYGGDTRYFDVTDSILYDTIYVYDVIGTWLDDVDGLTVGDTTYIVTSQNTGKWAVLKDYTSTSLKLSLGTNSAAFVGTDTILDSPFLSESRSTVTVSSVVTGVTDIAASQYIINGKTLSANVVEKTSSIVVGPGQTVVVNSATANNSFSLIGFEDNANDITTRVWAL